MLSSLPPKLFLLEIEVVLKEERESICKQTLWREQIFHIWIKSVHWKNIWSMSLGDRESHHQQ